MPALLKKNNIIKEVTKKEESGFNSARHLHFEAHKKGIKKDSYKIYNYNSFNFFTLYFLLKYMGVLFVLLEKICYQTT